MAEAVAAWLASPEYAHFCRPSSRGGTAAAGRRPVGGAGPAAPARRRPWARPPCSAGARRPPARPEPSARPAPDRPGPTDRHPEPRSGRRPVASEPMETPTNHDIDWSTSPHANHYPAGDPARLGPPGPDPQRRPRRRDELVRQPLPAGDPAAAAAGRRRRPSRWSTAPSASGRPTLAAAVAAGDAQITLDDASPFMVGDVLELASGERVEVTADPNPATNVVPVRRGAEGTTAGTGRRRRPVRLIGNSRTGAEVDQSAVALQPVGISPVLPDLAAPGPGRRLAPGDARLPDLAGRPDAVRPAQDGRAAEPDGRHGGLVATTASARTRPSPAGRSRRACGRC